MNFVWLMLGILAAIVAAPFIIWFLAIRLPILLCQIADRAAASNSKAAEKVYAAAVAWAKKTDHLVPKTLPRNFTALPLALEYQANYYFSKGEYEKSRTAQEERMRLLEESPIDQASAAAAASNLAVDYMLRGQIEHALTLAERCVRILKPAYENSKKLDAPELDQLQRRVLAAQLGSAVFGQAWILEVAQRFDQAEPLRRFAVEIAEYEFGRDGLEVAPHLNRIGNLFRIQGRYEEAEEPLKRCLANRIKHNAPVGMIASAKQGIGDLLLCKGEIDEAAHYIEDAFQMVAAAFPEDNPGWAEHAFSVGALRLAQKRYDDGEAILTKAIAVFENKFGKDNPLLLEGLQPLLQIYRENGRSDKEQELQTRVDQIKERLKKL